MSAKFARIVEEANLAAVEAEQAVKKLKLCIRAMERQAGMGTDRPDLRFHIRSMGWSQRKLATFLGVTHTHLNLMLKGVRESASLAEHVKNIPRYEKGMEITGGNS